MRPTRRSSLLVSTLAVSVLAAGCTAGLDDTPSGEGDGENALTLGFVSAQTGPLSGFGEADSFVVAQMEEHFADNPLTIGEETYDVEIILRDAQSDSTRAGEVAAELINTDEVDIILSTGTPDIVNPVADQCEANGTPCITTVAPWQPYYFGRGAEEGDVFEWTYHFFWGLEDVAATFSDMWSQVDTNSQAAGLFPNDPDGQAWSEAFPDLLSADGFTINDPGLYTNGSQDFSAQISAFKSNEDQILTGVPIPPDFTTFWQQAKQQDYTPVVATIGKALLFPSSLEALGDLGNNLGTEVWWTPEYPFSSSLTEQSAQELASAYEEETDKQWTQPLGFSHALFEVAAAAVTDAGSTDSQAVVDSLAALQVETVVGPLDWTSGPIPNVAKTPLAGGQWRTTEGGEFPYELVIVSNAVNSAIPVASGVEPLE